MLAVPAPRPGPGPRERPAGPFTEPSPGVYRRGPVGPDTLPGHTDGRKAVAFLRETPGHTSPGVSLRRGSSSSSARELVAEPTNGEEQLRLVGVVLDLLADPLHVDVERLGVAHVVVAPDLL